LCESVQVSIGLAATPSER